LHRGETIRRLVFEATRPTNVEEVASALHAWRTRRGLADMTRVGLVLGAGGVLGAAWMAGALTALQRRLPYPLGAVDLVVGTSAGSVLAAALRCGATTEEIIRHQRGTGLPFLPDLDAIDRDAGGRLPPLPRLRVGSPRLLLSTALAPHRMHPWVAASALVPQGRARHTSLEALVRGLLLASGKGLPAGSATAPPDWAPGGETWVVAVDYDSGQRVVFGREGAPPATLPEAVVASCSIPGWYRPAVVGGRRYVDGGVRSSTSLDCLAGTDLDEVYVLAPMASYVADSPDNPYARIERRFRRLITVGLQRDVRKVEEQGIRVTVLTPGPEDLAVIGANMMDPRRRIQVLDTSLRTSTAAVATLEHRGRGVS
jgi:NTE family protein